MRHFAHDASALQRVTELVGAGEHVCALHEKGVSCWGYNPYGGLGVVVNDAVTRPVRIRGLPKVVKLGG